MLFIKETKKEANHLLIPKTIVARRNPLIEKLNFPNSKNLLCENLFRKNLFVK